MKEGGGMIEGHVSTPLEIFSTSLERIVGQSSERRISKHCHGNFKFSNIIIVNLTKNIFKK
jgi:hypothetical protein